MKNNIEKIIHNTLRTYLNEQTSGLPDWTKNYPCLSDRGTMNKTTSNDQVVFFLENGGNWYSLDYNAQTKTADEHLQTNNI